MDCICTVVIYHHMMKQIPNEQRISEQLWRKKLEPLEQNT